MNPALHHGEMTMRDECYVTSIKCYIPDPGEGVGSESLHHEIRPGFGLESGQKGNRNEPRRRFALIKFIKRNPQLTL